ncbi:MAG: hypothetical protein U0414_22830 [Polyangiaceae bacterium]
MPDAPDTAAVRARILAYHREELDLPDAELDRLLGLAGAFEPRDPDDPVPPHVATPFPICRGLFHALSPSERDVVVDLGSGTGRVVVYGGLVSPAEIVGVELVEARARAAADAAVRLGLARATSVAGDALDPAFAGLFARATVFYAFRPFPDDVERRVFDAIETEG